VTADRPAWLDAGQMSPLDDKLGIEITDFDPDHVVGTMPALGAGPGRQAVGVELNVSYLRAATAGVVTAVATPVRRGRTLATFTIEVTDEQGRVTATARLTCMLLAA
jgi:1,4-dihydroxy-2-naphthoyl-CoA hydrolase